MDLYCALIVQQRGSRPMLRFTIDLLGLGFIQSRALTGSIWERRRNLINLHELPRNQAGYKKGHRSKRSSKD